MPDCGHIPLEFVYKLSSAEWLINTTVVYSDFIGRVSDKDYKTEQPKQR